MRHQGNPSGATGEARPARRRAGRPSSPLLSRQSIATAALALFDRRGGEGFTMADLARELQVHPSSLYNHVASKVEVIASVRELLSDRIDVDAFRRMPWEDAVAAWARSYRASFAAHPATIATLATMPLGSAVRTSRMYDAVTRGFLTAGWPEHAVVSAIVCLESFVLGSALDVSAPADMFELTDRSVAPAFAAAVAQRDATVGSEQAADDAFERGLRAIVHGLAAQLAALRTAAPPQ